MNRINARTKCALALALAGMLAIAPAMAEKPSWAGGGKADRAEESPRDSDRRDHFYEQHRVVVREYYSEQHRVGRQPPSGHRYVRVASDILLMAIGTGMIVDAIQDLGRL